MYGFIPSKATLFNLKCDPVFDFGVGVRNSIYYNGFGNLILFGGFGNLRGNIEVWNLNTKKIISATEAPDSTLLEWSPTGDIYATATTAPRLRMSNGFKIWHYSGALLHETMWPEKQELLEIVWQKFMPGSLKETQISNIKIQGIKSSQPLASKQKYVPPNIRNSSSGSNTQITQSVEQKEQPHRIPGLPPGYTSSAAIRVGRRTTNSKKVNNQNVKQPNNLSSGDNIPSKPRTPQNSVETNSKTNLTKQYNNGGGIPKLAFQFQSTDPERDKKIRKINQKLKEIRVLNSKAVQGEAMNSDQTKKINSEQELIAELKTLRAS